MYFIAVYTHCTCSCNCPLVIRVFFSCQSVNSILDTAVSLLKISYCISYFICFCIIFNLYVNFLYGNEVNGQ